MGKVIKKKSNKVGKSEKVNESGKAYLEAQELLQQGERFGESIIGMMSLFALDFVTMGAAAVGLAKALAALKDVSKEVGVNVQTLFDTELPHFERKYAEIAEEML